MKPHDYRLGRWKAVLLLREAQKSPEDWNRLWMERWALASRLTAWDVEQEARRRGDIE